MTRPSTPEDVLRIANDIEWDDLMMVGFNKDGRCVLISSHIGGAEALLLNEMMRQSILAELLSATPKYDA